MAIRDPVFLVATSRLTVFRKCLKTNLFNRYFVQSHVVPAQWLCHFEHYNRSFTYLLTYLVIVVYSLRIRVSCFSKERGEKQGGGMSERGFVAVISLLVCDCLGGDLSGGLIVRILFVRESGATPGTVSLRAGTPCQRSLSNEQIQHCSMLTAQHALQLILNVRLINLFIFVVCLSVITTK